MISKADISFIRSLEQKKYRHQHQLFIAEGVRMIAELLRDTPQRLHKLYATPTWIQENIEYRAKLGNRLVEISENELKKISLLTTPNEVLALVQFSTDSTPPTAIEHWTLVLDNLQDPGNFGTIIRTADWFGIKTIFCSPTCVDLYNPKVVQATMGSIWRVEVHYLDLISTFAHYSNTLSYAATLENGHSVWQTSLPKQGFLVIGNEGNGISAELLAHCKHRIYIPKLGEAESLNAAVATGILCAMVTK